MFPFQMLLHYQGLNINAIVFSVTRVKRSGYVYAPHVYHVPMVAGPKGPAGMTIRPSTISFFVSESTTYPYMRGSKKFWQRGVQL